MEDSKEDKIERIILDVHHHGTRATFKARQKIALEVQGRKRGWGLKSRFNPLADELDITNSAERTHQQTGRFCSTDCTSRVPLIADPKGSFSRELVEWVSTSASAYSLPL